MVNGRCIFCGNSPLTGEHLFPKWLKSVEAKMVPPHGTKTVYRASSGGPHIFNNWDGSPNVKIHAVCKACNEGWMHEIEVTARPILEPMILGDKVVLSPEDQLVVATWTCLKTFILACDLYSYMEHSWIEDFYRRRLIPTSWRMWITTYVGRSRYLSDCARLADDGSVVATVGETKLGLPLPTPEPSSGSLTAGGPATWGVVASFILGRFAVKVLGVRRPDVYGDPSANALLRLFPSRGLDMIWPTPIPTDDRILSVLLGMFQSTGHREPDFAI